MFNNTNTNSNCFEDACMYERPPKIIISLGFTSGNPVPTRYTFRHKGNAETFDQRTIILISVETVYIRIRPGISLINGKESSNESSLYGLPVHARQRSVIPVTSFACGDDHIGFKLSTIRFRLYNPLLLVLSCHIY